MFTRSQTVRELVETHIQEVMRLVIGDKKHSLPLPLDFAVLLQASAVEELKKWITAYPSMRRLATAEQYIQAHTVSLSVCLQSSFIFIRLTVFLAPNVHASR